MKFRTVPEMLTRHMYRFSAQAIGYLFIGDPILARAYAVLAAHEAFVNDPKLRN
jgi:hypothetical protein